MGKKNSRSFIKNVATLMTGTVLAQLCSIFASPVLSRIFTPEDFGLLASFNSVCSLMIVVCSFKYEQGILISNSEEEAQDVFYLALLVCILITIFCPIFISLISRFSTAFDLICSNGLIFLATLFIFCSGCCEILRVYFLRNKQFKIISTRTILVSLITVGLNISCGIFLYNKKVLVTSTTMGQIAALLLFVFVFFKLFKKPLKKIELKKLKKAALDYKQFPLFMMTGQLLNNFTGNLPILILGNFFSQSDIGQYSFVHKVVAIPMTVIGSSVNQVFLQKFSVSDVDEQKRLFKKTSIMLLLGILPFAILACIFAPTLFSFVFGEQWIPAANLARAMAIMFVVQFFTTPVTGVVYIVRKKLNCDFVLQIVRLSLIICSFLLSVKIFHFSFFSTILAFSISMVIFYIISYVYAIFILEKK